MMKNCVLILEICCTICKNSSCHKFWYKKEKGYLKISSFSKLDVDLLMWRAGLRDQDTNTFSLDDGNNGNNTVCFHYQSMFISCYGIC